MGAAVSGQHLLMAEYFLLLIFNSNDSSGRWGFVYLLLLSPLMCDTLEPAEVIYKLRAALVNSPMKQDFDWSLRIWERRGFTITDLKLTF